MRLIRHMPNIVLLTVVHEMFATGVSWWHALAKIGYVLFTPYHEKNMVSFS